MCIITECTIARMIKIVCLLSFDKVVHLFFYSICWEVKYFMNFDTWTESSHQHLKIL